MNKILTLILCIVLLPITFGLNFAEVKIKLENNPILYYTGFNATALLTVESNVPFEDILYYSIKQTQQPNQTATFNPINGIRYLNLSKKGEVRIDLGTYDRPTTISIDLNITLNNIDYIFRNVSLEFVTNTLLLNNIRGENVETINEKSYQSNSGTSQHRGIDIEPERRLDYVQNKISPLGIELSYKNNSGSMDSFEIFSDNGDLSIVLSHLLIKIYNNSNYTLLNVELTKNGYSAVKILNFSIDGFIFVDIVFSDKKMNQAVISSKFFNDTLLSIELKQYKPKNNMTLYFIVLFVIILIGTVLINYIQFKKHPITNYNKNFDYFGEIKRRYKTAEKKLKENDYKSSCLWLSRAIRLYVSYNIKIRFYVGNQYAINWLSKDGEYNAKLADTLKFCRDVNSRGRKVTGEMVEERLNEVNSIFEKIHN